MRTLVIATLLAFAPAPAADTVGAPGIGDAYYPLDGNGGYDVTHYDLRLSYQPLTDELWGTTTVLATATQDLTRFDLDFLLRTSAVRVNNAPARFVSQEDGELVVTPATRIAKGDRMVIAVTYRDKPSTHERYGFTAWWWTPTLTRGLGEPHIAPWWYPANDHPRDKATYDVSVAVPDGKEVISNGTLAGTRRQPGGWVRWNWRSTSPQGPYQTSLLVGDFDIVRRTLPDGRAFINAYDTSIPNRTDAEALIDRTPEIVAWESSVFGDYPFDAMGGTVTPCCDGLENQTRPTYGADLAPVGPGVVVHEMAHMWFGDSVSLHDWRDIWLNEGFATYAEWLWSEHTGAATAAQRARETYDGYPAKDPFWQTIVADPGERDLFASSVYERGALALHALRAAVGDTTFFRILRTWAATHEGGVATTGEFIELAERLAGRDLGTLFHTWLEVPTKPRTLP
ncbi:MAG TPA: M1 family metallopeptidase [Actinophytocola sp.]|jgi:aminopeptidase N|uniref:M1 family metallopeptidase n=1 Tax=Actinophytocola sp. TaxID=1872138 RepID=UPI002F95C736